MSETTDNATSEQDGGDVEARLEGLFAQLDGAEPIPQEAEASDEDGAPAEADQPNEAEAEGEQETVIAPPAFWNKEAKAHWDAIPAETQGYLVERETQRDTEVRRVQNEAAETRKAAHEQATALSQERAYLAQHIAPVLQELTTRLQGQDYSPDAMADLARTNPAAWAERSAERDRMHALHQQISAENARTHQITVQGEFAKLLEAIPEWKDEKARREDAGKLQSLAGEFGYSANEVMAVTDHRALRVLKELQVLRAKEAARAAPARKVAQPQAPARPLNGRSTPNTGQFLSREKIVQIGRSGDTAAQQAAIEQLMNRMG